MASIRPSSRATASWRSARLDGRLVESCGTGSRRAFSSLTTRRRSWRCGRAAARRSSSASCCSSRRSPLVGRWTRIRENPPETDELAGDVQDPSSARGFRVRFGPTVRHALMQSAGPRERPHHQPRFAAGPGRSRVSLLYLPVPADGGPAHAYRWAARQASLELHPAARLEHRPEHPRGRRATNRPTGRRKRDGRCSAPTSSHGSDRTVAPSRSGNDDMGRGRRDNVSTLGEQPSGALVTSRIAAK